MDVIFRTRKLAKIFSSEQNLKREYGDRMAQTILLRLAVLTGARTLEEVSTTRPDRRHQLVGRRKMQYAVDLVHPYRLIFSPDHEPLPYRDDGGIDTSQVTAIVILEVSDYHGGR